MSAFEQIRLALSGAIVGHAMYGLFDRTHEHYYAEFIGALLVLIWLRNNQKT